MSLRAGAGRRDISNRKPLFLVGYPHVERTSEGVHDPLYATALYLCSGGGKATISVAVDILFIHHRTASACRQAIAWKTGVSPECIMISATHTHSGPVTAGILSWEDDDTVPGVDGEYLAFFEAEIIGAAVDAYESAVEAELAVCSGYTEGVGSNRLSVDGVRDPEVGLVVVRGLSDGVPIAIQLVYSMHPTVLHEDSRLVSSDFPHYTRQVLEEHFPGAYVLYHNGPCGNLSPRYCVTSQTFEEAERLGRKLAEDVLPSILGLGAAAFRSDVTVGGRTCRVELPGRVFCTVAEAEGELSEAVADFERLKAEGAPHGPVRTAECTVFGAEERVTLARAQERGETRRIQSEYNPVEVQVLRIGASFLAALPGECFVEYALELKRRCPGTFVVSLANGELQGYIPTPEATGYEARLSFFEPEAGDRLVSTAQSLIDGLR